MSERYSHPYSIKLYENKNSAPIGHNPATSKWIEFIRGNPIAVNKNRFSPAMMRRRQSKMKMDWKKLGLARRRGTCMSCRVDGNPSSIPCAIRWKWIDSTWHRSVWSKRKFAFFIRNYGALFSASKFETWKTHMFEVRRFSPRTT